MLHHKSKSQAWRVANRLEDPNSWGKFNPFIKHRPQTYSSRTREPAFSGTAVGANDTDEIDHFAQQPKRSSQDIHDSSENSGDQEKQATTDGANGISSGATATSNNTQSGKFKRRLPWSKKNKNDQDSNIDPENNSGGADYKTQRHTNSLWGQIRYSIFNSWLNVLLVFAPVGIALHFVPNMSPVVIFVINFIAIIPLAGTLSYATEEISLRVGETVGGLLNASFGNAVELIVGIIALTQDKIVIVQTSLIGSMLSNLLLVMGMCFFFGGINRKKQNFNPVVVQTASSLLALAIGALIIPTAFKTFADDPTTNADNNAVAVRDAEVSRGTAVVLLVVYICYLTFQLKTHEELYAQESEKVEKQNLFRSKEHKDKGDANRSLIQGGLVQGANGMNIPNDVQEGITSRNPDDENKDDEREEPTLSWTAAIITLLWSTALVAVCAEFLVDAIDQVVSSTGISEVFVGLILLPIVGNAAEHATALTVACKDKMDLAIGVAVGSSMQIALLVLPFIVVIGWIIGKTDMTLNFNPFDIIILFVSVLLVNYLIADNESNWLEGIMLMVLYIIIALAAWFFPNRETTTYSVTGSNSTSSAFVVPHRF